MHSRTRLVLALVAAAFVVVPSSARAQETVEGQYIVVLKDGARGRQRPTASSDRARDRGARVEHHYRRVLNGFSATLTDAGARRVRNDADVAYVEPDQRGHARARRRRARPGASTASTSATSRSTAPTPTTPPAPA